VEVCLLEEIKIECHNGRKTKYNPPIIWEYLHETGLEPDNHQTWETFWLNNLSMIGKFGWEINGDILYSFDCIKCLLIHIRWHMFLMRRNKNGPK